MIFDAFIADMMFIMFVQEAFASTLSRATLVTKHVKGLLHVHERQEPATVLDRRRRPKKEELPLLQEELLILTWMMLGMT